MPKDIDAAHQRAIFEYQAAKRRDKYQILSRQVGSKIAEADLDLPDNKYMNVKLENRKGVDQVVLTIGKNENKAHAQVFIDLAKAEIRYDQDNKKPGDYIDAIKLELEDQSAQKQFKKSNGLAKSGLSEIEHNILRAVYKKDRASRTNKHTDMDIWHIFKNAHPGIEQNDFDEALRILISQKFFDKEISSHPSPSYYIGRTKMPAKTYKTTYYILSGKALLFLKDRV